jgi:hypothetical protein
MTRGTFPGDGERHAMFAAPEFSTVILVHPRSDAPVNLSRRFRKRIQENRDLLRDAVRVSGASICLLGAFCAADQPFASLPNCSNISGDAVDFWQDGDAASGLGPAETRAVYVGGEWLDEQVLFAALSAVRIGYDTRVLLDVSVARSLFDRAPALDRMSQHGVLMTTVRQAVVEWSMSTSDQNIGRQLRNILPQ